MIDFILNRLRKIKETKKFATEHNVQNWYNILLHGVILMLFGGLIISLGSILFLDNLESNSDLKGTLLMNLLWGSATGFPFLFAFALAITFLPKLIMMEVLLFEKINRFMFNQWQKLDMWYFRKHRKHSPLTDGYSKITSKYGSKISKKQKKVIAICLAVLLIGLQLIWRVPALIEDFKEMQETSEIEKNDESKVVNPIQEEKPLEIIIQEGEK